MIFAGCVRRSRRYQEANASGNDRSTCSRFRSPRSTANLEVGEEERLAAERDVLTNAERLTAEATEVHDLLVGDEFGDSNSSAAFTLIQRASAGLDAIALIDPSMSPSAERLRDVVFALEDVVSDSREYRDRIEADPARLETVEERLDLLPTQKKIW